MPSQLTNKTLIVIAGPTAVGKTAFAIRVAKHFDTSIISADSRQFYKEMSIGTAKPDTVQLSEVKHHFIGHISIHENYSVGQFERDALTCLNQIFETSDVAILTGGSGLFINAVCEGLDEFPEVPDTIRLALKKEFETKGIEPLQEELEQTDLETYLQIDLQNTQRVIRALEVCRASGQAFSSFRKKNTQARPFKIIYLLLNMDRPLLYQRINQRVDMMVADGLVEEARGLYPMRHLNALQTVGYKEIFDYFNNELTLPQAIDLVKQHSRNYAKRQLTWFRKHGNWQTFHPDDWEDAIFQITKQLA